MLVDMVDILDFVVDEYIKMVDISSNSFRMEVAFITLYVYLV